MYERDDWQVLWQGENQLGEGVLWHPELQTIFWVDIVRSELFALPWQQPQRLTRSLLPFKASHVARCDSTEHLVLATNKGIAKWHIEEQRLDDLITIPQLRDGMRCNDAAVAMDGSYWVGLMSEPATLESGCIVRVQSNGKVDTIKTDIGIPNTLLWSDQRFIYADSLRHTLFSQAVLADGLLHGEPEVLMTISSDHQTPDGSTMTTDGSIINAVWQGQRLQQLSQQGELLAEQWLPVYSPTCCTFCGPGLDYLVVTSARVEAPASALQAQPLSGSLIIRKQPFQGTTARVFCWPAK